MQADKSNDVRFLHYRNMNKAHVSETNPLGVSSRGGVTIAYRFGEDGKISFATAFCHEKDNYNKATGRIKASHRLKSEACIEHTDLTDNKQFLDAMDAEMESYTPSLITKKVVPLQRKYKTRTNKTEDIAHAA